jgi:hypothetical protein
MAIKGKGKSKPRSAAKAPRRAPVAVPAPFARRRWVQVTAAFVLGLGLFWLGIWVTNGLRDQDAQAANDAQLQQQVTALQRWQSQVETEIGPIAPLQDPLPPTLAADAKSAAASLAKGKEPTESPESLTTQADQLSAAADALEKFDLAGAVSGKGFGDGANTIIVSKVELVEALRLYSEATSLTVAAFDAPEAEAKAMAEHATGVMESADRLLNDAWRGYQLMLGSVGLVSGGGL